MSAGTPDSPVGGDGVETVPGSAAPGLTAGSERDRTPETLTGELRARLAAVAHAPSECLLGQVPISAVPSLFEAVERAVDAILADGWRRVSEDDDTVERVARAIHDRECGPEEGSCPLFAEHRIWYAASARVAVQALRDGSGT